MFRFSAVMTSFLVKILNSTKKRYTEQEIKSLLLEAGLNMRILSKIVTDNKHNPDIVAKVSELVPKRWTIDDSRQVIAAVEILAHNHPTFLDIKLLNSSSRTEELVKLFDVLKNHYSENLYLSLYDFFNSYVPCDELLLKLSDAR